MQRVAAGNGNLMMAGCKLQVGLLCETMGFDTPILAVPLLKNALARTWPSAEVWMRCGRWECGSCSIHRPVARAHAILGTGHAGTAQRCREAELTGVIVVPPG